MTRIAALVAAFFCTTLPLTVRASQTIPNLPIDLRIPDRFAPQHTRPHEIATYATARTPQGLREILSVEGRQIRPTVTLHDIVRARRAAPGQRIVSRVERKACGRPIGLEIITARRRGLEIVSVEMLTVVHERTFAIPDAAYTFTYTFANRRPADDVFAAFRHACLVRPKS